MLLVGLGGELVWLTCPWHEVAWLGDDVGSDCEAEELGGVVFEELEGRIEVLVGRHFWL